MSTPSIAPQTEQVELRYEADLLGNIQQALTGLQGFDVMALELIQNADDAGAVSLEIDVCDEALFVRNNAQFSTCGFVCGDVAPRCPWEEKGGPDGLKRPCNFHAISRMGSRSKIHAGDQIGRFGIGFVSVYQITDTPIIRSAGIEMWLEPLRGAAPTTLIDDTGGTEFELTWSSTASPTRDALNLSPTPQDVVPLLAEAVSAVMERGLFFLRHLRHVELRQNGALLKSVSISRESGFLTLEIKPGARVDHWKVLTREAADLAAERDIFTDFPTLERDNRSLTVSVAIPISDEPVKGLLYAYLPTEQASGLPLHINADFYPHPNRRSIVLSGEQHQRYWNELLLDTAANAIGDAFLELRNTLGAQALWRLGHAAHLLRQTRGFSIFWTTFSEASKKFSCVWSVSEEWHKPSESHFSPKLMTEAQQDALSNIGLNLVHADLRSNWDVLSAVGVTPLGLHVIVDWLEARGEDASVNEAQLQPLWSAIDMMIADFRSRSGPTEILKRLKAAYFLLDIDGESACANELWRLPPGVTAKTVGTYIAGCPLVHGEVYHHAAILDLIDLFGFDDLARHLAAIITDEDTASTVIGFDRSSVRSFYELLTSFAVVPEGSRADTILAEVPMLRTANGFVSPSRGQLPGQFVDPIGHFMVVDPTVMTEEMKLLATRVLGVPTLSFKKYVEDHLEDILNADPTREQYSALILQIVEQQRELDYDEGLQPLAEKEFIKTRSGSYALPRECYYWSAKLQGLLGDDDDNWVDEGWMPKGREGSKFRDLLENRLGMRTDVAVEHIVERIAAIAETGTIDAIADQTAPIIRHLLERWPRLDTNDRVELERLRNVAFLPGAISGQRVPQKRYPPALVYRAFRETGFNSQVPIVDLPTLRRGTSAMIEFLDLLKMPAEPGTEKVVAHLEHCKAAQLPANDTTYAILYERLESADAACIDRLVGTDFIYDAKLERYLKAENVFWEVPAIGGRWHTASSRMRQLEALYRRLGVADAPIAKNYALLLAQIASQAQPSQEDIAIHARCLAWLADALDQGADGASEAIESIQDGFTMLNVKGIPVWTSDALWLDSKWLAEPFDGLLDDALVAPPEIHRPAVSRFFRQFGLVPLSKVARLCLASEPDQRPAPDATDLLRERSPLLLWLAPSQEYRAVLKEILAKIEVRYTASLLVRGEITDFSLPVRSQARSDAAFYEPEKAILHLRVNHGEQADWSAAFRALFAQIESLSHGTDIRQMVMSATLVTALPTWTDAERALKNSGFHPPEELATELPYVEEIGASIAESDFEYLDTLGADSTLIGDQEIEISSSRLGGDGHRKSERTVDDSSDDYDVLEDEPDNGCVSLKTATVEPFKSKAGDNTFGTAPKASEPEKGGVSSASAAKQSGSIGETERAGSIDGSRNADNSNNSGGSRHQETSTERQSRRSRMLAYVSTGIDQPDSAKQSSEAGISDLIDVGAIAAVLKYEQTRGWSPEEQPHNNPGFDIVSQSADGSVRRLIEVKGLDGDWTERGIKLSSVQYGMAERYPDQYWIYVVENARNLDRQRVSAIANPFSKVQEYWFDENWRQVAEEKATAQDVNIKIGARVHHATWGIGTIVAIKRHGLAPPFLTVDFGSIEGRRGIPYSSSLKFVN